MLRALDFFVFDSRSVYSVMLGSFCGDGVQVEGILLVGAAGLCGACMGSSGELGLNAELHCVLVELRKNQLVRFVLLRIINAKYLKGRSKIIVI